MLWKTKLGKRGRGLVSRYDFLHGTPLADREDTTNQSTLVSFLCGDWFSDRIEGTCTSCSIQRPTFSSSLLRIGFLIRKDVDVTEYA